MALDSIDTNGLQNVLAKQKAANIRDGIPSAEKRIEWIDRSIDMLVTHGGRAERSHVSGLRAPLHRFEHIRGYRLVDWAAETLKEAFEILDAP